MFRLNMYVQQAANSCLGSCAPYLLVAFLVFGGLVCAKGQDLGAMPLYEERDTLVKYEDGIYQERVVVIRYRINPKEYIETEQRKKEERRQQAERLDSKLEADVARVIALDEGRPKEPPDKKEKAVQPPAIIPPSTTKKKKG